MFIYVAYKDDPELSNLRRRSSDTDLAVEKTLLVNPICYVRVMLEYIRNACKLGIYTNFDLCDENGVLKGLFSLPTYEYANNLFEHKKTYYVVVLRQDIDRRLSVIPQVNRQNKLYLDLKSRVWNYAQQIDYSPLFTPPQVLTPAAAIKLLGKK